MPKFALKANAEVDVLSKGELDDSLARYFANREVARLRGLKHMRLPETLYGTVASSAISLGVEKGNPPLGPAQGYVWTFKRLVVDGLKAGSSPDVVNLYKNNSAGAPIWQFNGNNFGYTFGKLEITLYGGETLALQNVGTISATGQIRLSGELIEVPAELIGKLA